MPLQNAIAAAACLAVLFSAGGARAEMACATYLQGNVAQDSYVLREATEIAAQLIKSGWSSPAMRTDAAGMVGTTVTRERLVLRQLTRDCRALPRSSVDRLVAVHMQASRSD